MCMKLYALLSAVCAFQASATVAVGADALTSNGQEAVLPGLVGSGFAELFPSKEPWFWDAKLFGRVQWQYGYVDGTDSNGADFNYDTTEVRRVYLGGQARFAKYFQVIGRTVLVKDRNPIDGPTDWGYQHIWDLALKADVKKLLELEALDAFVVAYGKKQLNVSDEWHVSSKYIKTVERSAIANKVWPYTEGYSNPTGSWFDLKQNGWKATAGIFSTDDSTEFSTWDDGCLFYGDATFTAAMDNGFCLKSVTLSGFYQDRSSEDEQLSGGLKWVGSLAAHVGEGPWELRGNFICGDNGQQIDEREGNFWGFVLLGSHWILQDRLEVVARYQYQGSEEAEGIRLWSRYARSADAVGDADLGSSGGRGDEHQSAYVGVNTHLKKDQLKLMLGLEYDEVTSESHLVYKGWTTYVGLRTFF